MNIKMKTPLTTPKHNTAIIIITLNVKRPFRFEIGKKKKMMEAVAKIVFKLFPDFSPFLMKMSLFKSYFICQPSKPFDAVYNILLAEMHQSVDTITFLWFLALSAKYNWILDCSSTELPKNKVVCLQVGLFSVFSPVHDFFGLFCLFYRQNKTRWGDYSVVLRFVWMLVFL